MGRGTAGLRPVDLARLAGVSTQQIRNYVDAGILPPTGRTAAGYRIFDDSHRVALLTYRALAGGYGWDTARAVMCAVHAGDVPAALALVDARHAALHQERQSLRAVGEALAAVASAPPDTSVPPRSGMRIGELATQLGVRTSTLRVWESAGLLAPDRDRGTRYRRYQRSDLRDARMILMLRQGRYPLSQIRPILDGLRQAGSTDALRHAAARRQEELTRRTTAMLAGASMLHQYLTGPQPFAGSLA